MAIVVIYYLLFVCATSVSAVNLLETVSLSKTVCFNKDFLVAPECVRILINANLYSVVVIAVNTLENCNAGSYTVSGYKLGVIPGVLFELVDALLGLFGGTTDNDVEAKNEIYVLKTVVSIMVNSGKSDRVRIVVVCSYVVCEVKVIAITVNVSIISTGYAIVVEEYSVAVELMEAIEAILKSIVRIDVCIIAIITIIVAVIAAVDRLGYFELTSCISLYAEHREHGECQGVLTLNESVRIIVVLCK